MIAPNEQIAGKKTRVKVAPVQLTREQAEVLLLEIAEASNGKIATTAEMDAELLAIKNKYQKPLADLDERIAAASEALCDYAMTHSEIFPKNRKSVEWTAGKFGFRTDTPSLALANRNFGWAKILGVIAVKKLRKFMRTKVEVDKDAILSRCGTLETPTKFQKQTLPTLGIKLVQEEKFFVEPDLTKAEARV